MTIVSGCIVVMGTEVPDCIRAAFPKHRATRRYYEATDEAFTEIMIPDTLFGGDGVDAEASLRKLLVTLNSVTTYGVFTFYQGGYYTRYRWELASDIPDKIIPDGMMLIRGRFCELANHGDWFPVEVVD